MKYDLVVVGGGPGGLMAARTASRQGMQVLVVEKNKAFGIARRLCSRLLRLGAGGFQSDIEVTDAGHRKITITIELDGERSVLHLKPLPPDADVRYTGAWAASFNDTWFSPSGFKLHHKPTDDHFTGLIIDKDALLAGMAAECAEAGCELRAATQAVAIEDGPDSVTLELKSGDTRATVRARKAVIADGSFSPLLEQLDFNEGRKVVGVRVKFLTLILDGVASNYVDTHRVKFCFPSLHRGYITLSQYPPGRFQLGATTTTGSQVNLPTVLEHFMAESPYADWFAESKVLGRTGCNMDLRPPVWEPAKGNVICAGDNVAYGETSIKHAMGCGYIAAHAMRSSLDGGNGNAEYNEFWQNSLNYFSKQYRAQIGRTKSIPAVLNDEEADTLFRWLQDNSVCGLPQDCLPDNRNRLYAEMPGIAEKLMGPRDTEGTDRAA
ncbi:MAG: FAD-dependent oxidoreductase [Chromatiales bacterium]|nr:MAG: FAD-dependent oxidoreductase [Chromatiales bacterium]